MIKVLKKGTYQLIITKEKHKILYLDDDGYVWVYVPGIGELLQYTQQKHTLDYTLATGAYKIYKIKDEPDYIDLEHLELSTGRASWQGYLLLTGLPTASKTKSKIVPTTEVIRKK